MRMEKELKRKRILQQSVAFKRQRLLLKAKRMSKEATKTVLEGKTFFTTFYALQHFFATFYALKAVINGEFG